MTRYASAADVQELQKRFLCVPCECALLIQNDSTDELIQVFGEGAYMLGSQRSAGFSDF